MTDPNLCAGTYDPTMGGPLVFTSPSGSSTTIVVPTAAVTQPTTLIYTPVSTTSVPPGYVFGGLAFTLVASQSGTILSDFSFLWPVAVSIHYTDSDVAGLDKNTLVLYCWDTATSTWKDVATSCSPTSTYWRYPAQYRVVVAICHSSGFGSLGVIGEIPTYDGSVYLPPILGNEQAAAVQKGKRLTLTRDQIWTGGGWIPVDGWGHCLADRWGSGRGPSSPAQGRCQR